jgi:hypothetical protein
VNADDVQPVIEIETELAIGNQLEEVAARRRHNLHVDAPCPARLTNSLDLTELEEPEEQRLHACAAVADFVEHHGSAPRGFKDPMMVANGAAEAASDVPEQLRLEERIGDTQAVDRPNRAQSPGAPLVKDIGSQLCRRRSPPLPTPSNWISPRRRPRDANAPWLYWNRPSHTAGGWTWSTLN